MARLNVRCCCTPTKILGTLPAPPEGFTETRFSNGLVLQVRKINFPHTVSAKAELHLMENPHLRALYFPKPELAYYSEETPLEALRQIAEFREGDRV